jgi:hypothetical protein
MLEGRARLQNWLIYKQRSQLIEWITIQRKTLMLQTWMLQTQYQYQHTSEISQNVTSRKAGIQFKMRKNGRRLGLRPRHAGGAYSAPPDPQLD